MQVRYFVVLKNENQIKFIFLNDLEGVKLVTDYKDEIYAKYGDGTIEDKRATFTRSTSLEYHYTKKTMSAFITKESRVLEVGCATGYYGMHFANQCKEYVGIDLVPSHIVIFESKIVANSLKNVTAMVGDATDLSCIADNSFEVVMCLGPMYHLPPEKRELALKECKRVCKVGGIIAIAYINRVGVYVGGCVHDTYRDIYPNERANKYVLRRSTDDIKPDLFYFTMPEEIEEVANRHDLTKIRNIGTDFFITASIVDEMNDEKFALYTALADEMVKYESCTGMSNHALLICRK